MSRIKFLTHKCISSNLNTIYLNLNTINFPNHGVGGGVWGSFGREGQMTCLGDLREQGW